MKPERLEVLRWKVREGFKATRPWNLPWYDKSLSWTTLLEEATVEIERLHDMVDRLLDEVYWEVVGCDKERGPVGGCHYCRKRFVVSDGESHEEWCPHKQVQEARDWK